MELKNTNNDIVESHNGGDGSVKDSEYLRKDIAMVLVQLKEANGQACGFHKCYLVLFIFSF